MQIIEGLDNLIPPEKPVVMTVGNFDGVHLGHQAIMRKVVEIAREHQFTPVVMTFEFHPMKFLNPRVAPKLLMPLDQRLKIMKGIGIERVVIARCNKALLQMNRETFVRNVLIDRFRADYIVEGPNFHFGCDRTGNIDYLIRIAPSFGFQAVKIEPVEVDLDNLDVKIISSSLIRKLIMAGRVELAKKCLGRPYQLVGQVISGAKRGRVIGFPTANLDVDDQLLPENGIYAARATIEDRTYPAAAIVGPAPTFEQYNISVEAFLIDYSGDLYGKTIDIDLFHRLRDIIKFRTLPDLIRQINLDIETIRNILKQEDAI